MSDRLSEAQAIIRKAEARGLEIHVTADMVLATGPAKAVAAIVDDIKVYGSEIRALEWTAALLGSLEATPRLVEHLEQADGIKIEGDAFGNVWGIPSNKASAHTREIVTNCSAPICRYLLARQAMKERKS